MAKPEEPPMMLPHQSEGTEFLRSRDHAGLFDEQGLGKSKQLIDAIAAEVAAARLKGAVIVCPNGLKTNWAEEIERFSSLTYAVFGSGRKARRQAFQSLTAAFYVINYEAVAAEMPSVRALLRFKPMALVLDESHRIKTPEAKVTKALLELRNEAKRRYILTGTPVGNKPEDLWSQFFFLDSGEALGETFEEFRERYGPGQAGYTDMEGLRERAGALSIRRLKDHAVNLPDKTVIRLSVELSEHQKSIYRRMRNDFEVWVRTLDSEDVLKHAEAILARLVRLAQIASNPALLDVTYPEVPAKFVALDELLAERMSAPDQKVIIWTSFVDNVATLVERYEEYCPVMLHGQMTNDERDAAVRGFKHDAGVRLLVANPAAAREGLTLTEANIAVYLDRTFNLVDYLQSQDRIHRISQLKPCQIVLLIAESTVDEFIDYTIEQKHRLACFAQSDTAVISPADLRLEKPAILQALLAPTP